MRLPDTEDVGLWVEADDTYYQLFIKCGGCSYNFAVDVEALTIMPPVGGAFTGVMYGIYSFGKGEPVLDPADFIDIYVKL